MNWEQAQAAGAIGARLFIYLDPFRLQAFQVLVLLLE